MHAVSMREHAKNRLLFCITSGRSGSEYLAKLLATAKRVRSYHELEPTMSGRPLELANILPYDESFGERLEKAEAVRRRLRWVLPGGIYSETNHMFIKTFWDVIMDGFDHDQIEVIILRRELARTLKSFVDLAYFTPLNPVWRQWMTSPNAITAAIRCVSRDEDMDQYDLSIAYLIDIEARGLRFQTEFPEVTTHEVRIESLNSQVGVEKLFRKLRIEATPGTAALTGQVINRRTKRKEHFSNPSTIEYCRERIEKYLSRCNDLGIVTPSSLALEPFSNSG